MSDDGKTEPNIADLHVFHNGADWVIARDAADAQAAHREHLGPGSENDSTKPFELVADDHPLWMHVDANGNVAEHDAPGARTITVPAIEWVRKKGRGFLASTEW